MTSQRYSYLHYKVFKPIKEISFVCETEIYFTSDHEKQYFYKHL